MQRPVLTRLLAGALAAAVLLGLSTPAPAAAPRGMSLLPAGDEGLDEYLAAPTLSKEAIALFQRATRSARAGQHEQAERAYVQLASQSNALADWAYVFAADAAARRGDTAAVRRHLRSSSDWLAHEWGWRARVRSTRVADNARTAATLALSIAEGVQLPASRAQARRMAAELQLAAGDTTAARETLRTVVQNPVAAATAAAAAALLPGISTSSNDLMISASALLAAGDHRAAARLLPQLLARPTLAGTGRAQFRLALARTHFNARRYAQAEKIASALILDASEPIAVRADARVLLGRSLLRRGQRAAAIVQFDRAIGSNVPSAIGEAAFLLGDLRDDEALASAARFYRLAAQTTPATPSAGEAMMRLGAAAYARARYDSALHWFEQARSGSASMRQRATYWSARTRVVRGDTSARPLLREIMADDPVSYYAFRAAEQLGVSNNAALSDGPTSTEAIKKQMQRAFDRWDLLRDTELSDAAAFELDRIRRSFTDAPPALYALAEQMHAANQTMRAISLGRELHRTSGQWDARLLRIVYPLPYQKIIEAEARKQGVDPYLAAALIRQESSFNPRALSVAGARGLMQVMPRTGRTIANNARITRFKVARLFEPELNVKLGIYHLKDLLQEYSGRLPHVLSAYNAGPHRLARWSGFPEAVDDELFVERIPYTETRDYVRIVQQNASIYRALYGAR